MLVALVASTTQAVMPVIVAVVSATSQLPETFANVTAPPPDPPEELRVTVGETVGWYVTVAPSVPFVRAVNVAWVALVVVMIISSIDER